MTPTGIPLTLKLAGLPEPDQPTLEQIIAKVEEDFAALSSPQGTWYSDPSCLEPVEDEE